MLLKIEDYRRRLRVFTVLNRISLGVILGNGGKSSFTASAAFYSTLDSRFFAFFSLFLGIVLELDDSWRLAYAAAFCAYLPSHLECTFSFSTSAYSNISFVS